MAQIREWLETYSSTLELLGFCSLLMFVITLVAVPIVIILLPEDYFAVRRRKPVRRSDRSFPFRIGFIIAKNLLGTIIIIAGVAMLFLPGQGVITILIGLALTNFPGKFALERRIARQPKVNKTLNWIRTKAGKTPFVIPQS